jgi:hypothetical protein
MRRDHLTLTVTFPSAMFAICVATCCGQQAEPPNVFDLPRLQAEQAARQVRSVRLLTAGEYAAAEELLRESVEESPWEFHAHYNLACALALQDKQDEALAALEQAVELGFRNREHIADDEDLRSLRDDERFEEILKAADAPLEEAAGWKYEVSPAIPAEGQVVITEQNVVWTPQIGMFRALVQFPEETSGEPIAVGQGDVGDRLREWFDEGTAAGNHGDLYDNHDSDHSNLQVRNVPQITRVEFSDAARERGLHHGLQRAFLYNAITIGNSSTAVTGGPFWRCQGRLALTQPQGAARMHLQYRANQLYFYPEHRDHDPKHGDVFPANTPYLILSQGSSGSDRQFLLAVADTLAAFRPEVKRQLAAAGLLMPTMQMILRSSNKVVTSPEDYLTGAAHPTVFDGAQLDPLKMITMAHDMEADSLPPLAQMAVVEEDEGVVGRDYFDVGPREKMFDTPCAIARVVKSSQHLRRMVVSAEQSGDLRDKPLTYHWVVLRGDADRIQINPQNDAGSVVELLVPYHERLPVPGNESFESHRVDIGLFVHNGDYYSAPAFISLCYPDGEERIYDDEHRIRVVDYLNPEMQDQYTDPLVDLRKDWRDEYNYDDEGRLLGWTRTRASGQEEFTADGRLVIETDDAGKPTETVAVRYVQAMESGKPVLKQEVVEESAM